MGKATSTCDMPDQNECIVVDVANAYVVDNAADYAEEWDNLPNSEGERDAPDLTVQELKNKSIAEFSVRGGGERSTDGYKQDKKGKGTASRRNKKRKHFVSRTCDDCFDKNDNDDPLIQRSVAKFYRGEDGVKRIYFGTIVSAGSIGEYEMYRITYGDGDSEYTMKEDINELLQVYRENMNKYVDMQVIDTYSKAQQIVKNCTLENTREKELQMLCRHTKKLEATTKVLKTNVRSFRSNLRSEVKDMKSELCDLLDTLKSDGNQSANGDS